MISTCIYCRGCVIASMTLGENPTLVQLCDEHNMYMPMLTHIRRLVKEPCLYSRQWVMEYVNISKNTHKECHG